MATAPADATAPETVDATKPAAKQKKAKEPKAPKPPRDPRALGEVDASGVVKNYKVPKAEDLKKMDKTALRQVLRKQGQIPHRIANFMSPREIVAVLTNDYPFESKGYGVNGRKVKDYEGAVKLFGDRAVLWTEKEKVESDARAALRRETFGELGELHKDNPTELMRAILADKTWIPVQPELGVRTLPSDERFYDLDGRAGRKQFYEFVPKEDVKKDGSPKANAKVIRISPQVLEDKILTDAEFKARFELPEGFGAKPEPKPRKKKAEQSIEDSLATMGEDNGSPAADATGLDEALGATAESTEAEAPEADTADQVAMPDLG